MALDPALVVAHDRLAVTGKRDRLDSELCLLAHFAHHRLMKCLAGFDCAAGQRVTIERRHARAPHH